MAFFVQLEDKQGDQVWHVVESYEAIGEGGESSMGFDRSYKTGCGLTQEAPGHRLAEADVPPWTHRHRYKGCFATSSDPQ